VPAALAKVVVAARDCARFLRNDPCSCMLLKSAADCAGGGGVGSVPRGANTGKSSFWKVVLMVDGSY
jgi:hypothetical protein